METWRRVTEKSIVECHVCRARYIREGSEGACDLCGTVGFMTGPGGQLPDHLIPSLEETRRIWEAQA